MISNALMYPCVTTVNQCGCIYPGISMITTYVYQFCQPTYSQDIYRCLCQTYVGVHPPTYSQGEYSCIYLFHQNTYIQGFYHWSNGVVGTAYTRITEWSICIYLYPGFVQSVVQTRIDHCLFLIDLKTYLPKAFLYSLLFKFVPIQREWKTISLESMKSQRLDRDC